MLLKDSKSINGNNIKTLTNPIKSPTYMPPIKGIDRSQKQFYSPTSNTNLNNNYKRIGGFPPNNSPRKDYTQSRLKVNKLHTPNTPY